MSYVHLLIILIVRIYKGKAIVGPLLLILVLEKVRLAICDFPHMTVEDQMSKHAKRTRITNVGVVVRRERRRMVNDNLSLAGNM